MHISTLALLLLLQVLFLQCQSSPSPTLKSPSFFFVNDLPEVYSITYTSIYPDLISKTISHSSFSQFMKHETMGSVFILDQIKIQVQDQWGMWVGMGVMVVVAFVMCGYSCWISGIDKNGKKNMQKIGDEEDELVQVEMMIDERVE